jgi:hypothetical protein
MVVYSDSESKLATNLYLFRLELDKPLPHLVTSNFEPLITCGKYFGPLCNFDYHKLFPVVPNHKRSLELRTSDLRNYPSLAKLLDYRYGRILNHRACGSDGHSGYNKLRAKINQ